MKEQTVPTKHIPMSTPNYISLSSPPPISAKIGQPKDTILDMKLHNPYVVVIISDGNKSMCTTYT